MNPDQRVGSAKGSAPGISCRAFLRPLRSQRCHVQPLPDLEFAHGTLWWATSPKASGLRGPCQLSENVCPMT